MNRQATNPIGQLHEETSIKLAQLAATYADSVIAGMSAEDRAALAAASFRIPRYIEVLTRGASMPAPALLPLQAER